MLTSGWILIVFAMLYLAVAFAGYWFFIRPARLPSVTAPARVAEAAAPFPAPSRPGSGAARAVLACAWLAVRGGLCLAGDLARREGWKFIALLGLPLIPAALVLGFGDRIHLGGYEEEAQTNPVVMALLQGERLVPPPPLPPEVFLTPELQAERPSLASANRDWELLKPELRQRLLYLFDVMAKKGYQLAFLEGYRSPARQNMLADTGQQVTNARAYQSYHQYGLAADIAFYRGGKIVISEQDPWAMAGYQTFGEEAERLGLRWGGRWAMRDFGHVELRDKSLLAGRAAS